MASGSTAMLRRAAQTTPLSALRVHVRPARSNFSNALNFCRCIETRLWKVQYQHFRLRGGKIAFAAKRGATTMPADERPTITLTIETDNGEKIEVKQQPVDFFADHPPFAAPFYCAIGKLIIQQGYIEHQLSTALRMCRNLETERPVQVRKGKLTAGEKIKFIREVLETGRLFGEASDDPMWTSILTAAAIIAKKRNDIVHGVVVGFDNGPPQCLLVRAGVRSCSTELHRGSM